MQKHLRFWERERLAGKISGLEHGTPVEGWDMEKLYRENLIKMERVLREEPKTSLIYAYWHGYSQGLEVYLAPYEGARIRRKLCRGDSTLLE